MMGVKLLLYMAGLALSISQPEMKESQHFENISLKMHQEINMEHLDKKIEELIVIVEENRKRARNLLRNTVEPAKKELIDKMENSIGSLKAELTNRMDMLNTSIENIKKELTTGITQTKSDISKISEKLTSEISDVFSQVNNIKLNITGEINELKQFGVQTEIYNKNITAEFKKTNTQCENNKNKLSELRRVIDELKPPPFYPRNCAELLSKSKLDGIQTVYPFDKYPGQGISVVCDQHTEGGGWTVFQTRDYRVSPRENFFRDWKDYLDGFGDLSGEFWLGLETIHKMTTNGRMELRVDLEDGDGEKRYAIYRWFSIDNSTTKFRLNIGAYYGNAGDSLAYHNQRRFSTRDQDNSEFLHSCAKTRKGAWWYGDCCHSNLNGYQFVGSYADDSLLHSHGIDWKHFRGFNHSMRKVKMMFRPH